MNGINEGRDEVSLAHEVDLVGSILPRRREGTRTIVATTGEYNSWRLSRVGLTLDDAIAEELGDYRRALSAWEEGGRELADFPDQPDITLWEGDKCLAVIRYRAGEPDVTRFDG